MIRPGAYVETARPGHPPATDIVMLRVVRSQVMEEVPEGGTDGRGVPRNGGRIALPQPVAAMVVNDDRSLIYPCMRTPLSSVVREAIYNLAQQ